MQLCGARFPDHTRHATCEERTQEAGDRRSHRRCARYSQMNDDTIACKQEPGQCIENKHAHAKSERTIMRSSLNVKIHRQIQQQQSTTWLIHTGTQRISEIQEGGAGAIAARPRQATTSCSCQTALRPPGGASRALHMFVSILPIDAYVEQCTGNQSPPRPARVEADYGTACRPRAPRASDTRASRLASACRRRTTCSAASIAFSSRCAVAGSTARRYRAVSSSVKRGDGGQRCSRKPQRRDGERRTRGFNSPHTRRMHVLARGIPTFSPRHLVLTQEP